MADTTLTMSAATPAAVGAARRRLAAELDRWGCARTPDSLLVFSELVANAVRHAGGTARIRVIHRDHVLRMEVLDAAAGHPAITGAAGSSGGYGLRIVDELTTGWGWEPTAGGKLVWAELDCGPDPLDSGG